MTQRLWQALLLFWVLFRRIPMIEARRLLPSVLLLTTYPVMLFLWPAQADLAFTTAFVLCQTARFSFHWPADGDIRKGPAKRIFAAILIPAAVLIVAQYPVLCQHFPTLISAGYVLLLAIDGLDGSYSTTRSYWPGKTYAPYLRELTQVLVILHLVYILLNETLIVVASLHLWLVFFAILPILHHLLLTALFRTVFWLAPDSRER
jgi:hypothetical protein